MIAAYFAFWAWFVLKRWRPQVVIVTGSSGKTTLLHMIEAQLGDRAKYSHHANSSFGIPFDILGLTPNVLGRFQWIKYVVLAPFYIFRKVPGKKLYIVEADCDRPHEGKFLARLLKPEVVLWVSVYRTHSMNFDGLVTSGQFKTHEQAIAYEFGYFAEAAQRLVVLNADIGDMTDQLSRVGEAVRVVKASLGQLKRHSFHDDRTTYVLNGRTYSLPGLHPKELAINLQLTQALMEYLDQSIDVRFEQLYMPPGRSSVFKGKNNITIVDSTYNTGLGAMTAIVGVFEEHYAKHKWLVLGDILEQGSVEREEHERLAEVLQGVDADQIVLLGPRAKKYTYPLLKDGKTPVVAFEGPREVLNYLQENLKGGETLLFKGARGLEGVIEQLLADPRDARKLVRREKLWIKRRQKWGLPR